jgi:DNA-binding winged helix-turn-helix (wHTH) protein/tetratricopeptide (TPR) repeat protein
MPNIAGAAPTAVRFDCFDVDFASGRLSKHGVRVRLREKSFQVLAALLEHPGAVVSREDLQRRLWHGDVFVDFENNLNTTIGRLREALGDSAERPRFIETLPKHGYRFMAEVRPARPEGRRAAARILVLPFACTADDSAGDGTSDALTSEVIADLARFAPDRIAAIARATAMHYKGTRKSLPRIGRELAVDYIVEGAVRRDGDRLVADVQLSNAMEQTCGWSQRFDVAAGAIHEASHAMVAAIAAHLGAPGGAPPRPRPLTRDVIAYNEYMRARQAMQSVTPAALFAARQHLERAIARDPQFALAYDAMAEAYWYVGYLGFAPPTEAFSTGVLFAVRALELDDTLAETHALLGQYHKQLHYDWPQVEREMTRALQLDPQSPGVRVRYAINFLMPLGRIDEAVVELERAVELDPLSAHVHTMLPLMLVLARRFDSAIHEARVLLEIEPNAYWAYTVISSCCRDTGRLDEAVRFQEKAVALSGGASIMIGWLGLAQALAGRTREARDLLAALHTRAAERYVPPTAFAWIHLGLGQIDDAFVWLDRGVVGLDQMMMAIKSYAFFDPIRRDPRYLHLLRKMHLQP